MSCCQPVDRKTFLEEKLKNFRVFLEPHCVSDELKDYLGKFNDLDSVMPYLAQCVILYKSGQLDAAVEKFCETLPATSERDAVVVKVKRYLNMFVDVLISA
jgi:hypothetical protein